jgi:hypothetical protein
MVTFKFKITEFWMGGEKEPRFIEVKARTEKSAFNKVFEIRGNRNWWIELVGVQ